MRVLVTADDKVLHDDSDAENILSGITAFQLACGPRMGYNHVQIRMWNTEFDVELSRDEVVDIIRQYGG